MFVVLRRVKELMAPIVSSHVSNIINIDDCIFDSAVDDGFCVMSSE